MRHTVGYIPPGAGGAVRPGARRLTVKTRQHERTLTHMQLEEAGAWEATVAVGGRRVPAGTAGALRGRLELELGVSGGTSTSDRIRQQREGTDRRLLRASVSARPGGSRQTPPIWGHKRRRSTRDDYRTVGKRFFDGRVVTAVSEFIDFSGLLNWSVSNVTVPPAGVTDPLSDPLWVILRLPESSSQSPNSTNTFADVADFIQSAD